MWVDSLELISISDDMARHNALLSGDVDIIAAVDPRLVALVRKRGLAVMESPTGTYTNLAIRQDVGPGRNADFIRAMKLLFNREQMRDSIYLGYCRMGNDQPLPLNIVISTRTFLRPAMIRNRQNFFLDAAVI